MPLPQTRNAISQKQKTTSWLIINQFHVMLQLHKQISSDIMLKLYRAFILQHFHLCSSLLFGIYSSSCKTRKGAKPSLVKALGKDLKTFEEKYPACVSPAWTKWVQDVNKLLELPIKWAIGYLMVCSNVRPATEDVTIPAHLQALRDKERQLS